MNYKERKKNVAHGREIKRLENKSERLAAEVDLGKDLYDCGAKLGIRRPHGIPVSGNQYHCYVYEIIGSHGCVALLKVDLDRNKTHLTYLI
jgi:hypothetical protein